MSAYNTKVHIERILSRFTEIGSHSFQPYLEERIRLVFSELGYSPSRSDVIQVFPNMDGKTINARIVKEFASYKVTHEAKGIDVVQCANWYLQDKLKEIVL